MASLQLGTPSDETWFFVAVWIEPGVELGIRYNGSTSTTSSDVSPYTEASGSLSINPQSLSSAAMAVDEFGFWKRVLTSTELDDLYNGGSPTGLPGGGSLLTDLISWWNMDEASGDALDSVDGHDLTDIGTSIGSETGIVNDARSMVAGDLFASSVEADLATTSNGVTIAGWVKKHDGTANLFFANHSGLAGYWSASDNKLRVDDHPASLTFSVQPSNAAAGVAISPDIEVTSQASSFTGPITLSINNNPGGSTLTTDTNPVNATAGVSLFTNSSLNHGGTGYTLDASAPGHATVTSDPFDITGGGGSSVPVFVNHYKNQGIM